MRKVKATDTYDDITFCTNHKCRKKTCYRHICHCAYLAYHSEAEFEGKIQYCLKAQEADDKAMKEWAKDLEEESKAIEELNKLIKGEKIKCY